MTTLGEGLLGGVVTFFLRSNSNASSTEAESGGNPLLLVLWLKTSTRGKGRNIKSTAWWLPERCHACRVSASRDELPSTGMRGACLLCYPLVHPASPWGATTSRKGRTSACCPAAEPDLDEAMHNSARYLSVSVPDYWHVCTLRQVADYVECQVYSEQRKWMLESYKRSVIFPLLKGKVCFGTDSQGENSGTRDTGKMGMI